MKQRQQMKNRNFIKLLRFIYNEMVIRVINMTICICQIDGWINGWMDGWMDGWIDGWMDG